MSRPACDGPGCVPGRLGGARSSPLRCALPARQRTTSTTRTWSSSRWSWPSWASGWNIIAGFTGYVSLGQARSSASAATRRRCSPRACSTAPRRSGSCRPPRSSPARSPLSSGRLAAHARACVRDPHDRVPVPRAVHRAQLDLAHQRDHGADAAAPAVDRDYANWPFHYASSRCSLISVATRLVDPPHEARHGPDRDPRGRGQGGDGRRQHPGLQDPRVRRQRGLLGMAGGIYAYYLSFIDPRGMFSILFSVQLLLAMLLGGRGTLLGRSSARSSSSPSTTTTNQYFGGGNARLFIFGGLLVARRALPAARPPPEHREPVGAPSKGKAGRRQRLGTRLERGQSRASDRAAARRRPGRKRPPRCWRCAAWTRLRRHAGASTAAPSSSRPGRSPV